MQTNTKKKVSLVIPVRNEENHIQTCIGSILNQDFPIDKLEVIFIDGNSSDDTKKIINHYIEKYPDLIFLFDNPQRTVPFAMNIGIKKSTGDYIIRLDAHSEYPNNYISECIRTIENIEADNVGGIALTKGDGFIGNTFAKVLSSKFGVGNSGFRTNAKSGYVDTVPFGTFKKEAFEKYGYYDVRLTRNQDYELNYRIRKMGGKIYLNSDIRFTYFCKNTLSGILKQSYENGKWNIITSKLCPGTMSVRHFIPLIFTLSLIGLPILGFTHSLFNLIFLFELLLYFGIALIVSLRVADNLKEIPMMILLFPLFHISYGLGSLIGFLNFKS
jgi:glycosyltransferase involved in cell wall biosynthesis